MRKSFIELVRFLFKKQSKIENPSLFTFELLKRDLKNCLSITDLKVLCEVISFCKPELTIAEFSFLCVELTYRKWLINYCDRQLTKERYTDHEIRTMFKQAQCLAKIEAILLHLEKNKKYYTSDYYTTDFDKILGKKDLSVFQIMANKRISSLLKEQKNTIVLKLK